MAQQKWFHAIGACGKATANVARMFKKMGWFVTGTDIQFVAPASEIITKSDIPFELGFHYSHLTREFWEQKLGQKLDIPEYPDAGLIVDWASSKNKEYLFAKKHNIDVRPFAQILGDYLVKPESIVVIGSAGKTTTTSLLTFLLKKLDLNPSYMIGADVVDFNEALENTDSNWSVLEGDEYYGKEVARGPKFLEYKPKYLVITKISWEHLDVFPTQEEYIEAFGKAVEAVPEDGLIIAKNGDENIDKIIERAKCKVIRYQKSEARILKPDTWTVEKSEDGLNKIFNGKGELVMDFKTKLIGDYNLENILASIALILNLPASSLPEDLVSKGTKNLELLSQAISEFNGVKKRLEILYKSEKLIIVDDFGIAPERAKNSLETLHEYFPDFKLIAVFDPNTGSRPTDVGLFNKIYKNSFNDAFKIIIPDLTTNSELIQTEQMVQNLKNLSFDTIHVATDQLVSHLQEKLKGTSDKILICFFSAYRLTDIAHKLTDHFKNL